MNKVLVKDAPTEISGRREFDAGNLHGRWALGARGRVFIVKSYEDVIAWSNLEDDREGLEVWHMTYRTDVSKTTRWHLNVVQRTINNLLW